MDMSPGLKTILDEGNVAKIIETATYSIAYDVLMIMVKLAPVISGNLRDGHYLTQSGHQGGDFIVGIGNLMYYWMYVIFGSSKQTANPYHYHALNSSFSGGGIDRSVKIALKEAWGL